MTTIGELIGDVWLQMLSDPKVDPEMRRQALRHSILADLREDRFFEAHCGVLRVGHRRWRVREATLRIV